MTTTSSLVRVYAALLAVSGAVLLFLPETLAPAASRSPVLAQIVGGALLAFAIANWMARDAVLGGIYNRPLVAGNQAFAVIGALVLIRGLETASPPAAWALTAVLGVGAVLYSVLLFRGPLSDSLPPAPRT